MSNLLIPLRANIIAKIPIFCQVMPLARPRMKWAVKGTYQPLKNQQELRQGLTFYDSLSIDQPVIIDTYINLKRAKTSKMKFPTGRCHGDEDNLRKAINDAIVHQRIITDDKLILGGENYKFFGEEDVCLIVIYSVNPTASKDVWNV